MRQTIITRQIAGFTLLELLIVITIIAILASMILAGAVTIRERARVVTTQARMQNVLNALSIYGSVDGSHAFALQTTCGLGGVRTFASIKVINDSIGVGCSKPPGFTQVTDTGAKLTFDSTTYDSDNERLALWRRLIDNVFDAMPPSGATWSLADYQSAPTGGWPTQWPETDWDQATPGAQPPILRFPWGKPGLRIDGSICDPAADTSDTLKKFPEWTTYSGTRYAAPSEPILNEWVTTGDELSARIWQWTSTDATQTDSVRLDSATRSDGSAVATLGSAKTNSNIALPFDLGWMSPLQTIPLLQAAGVLDPDAAGAEDYRTKRTPSAAWNDAWGHPLVVMYALFQPERYQRNFDDLDRRDFLLKAAVKEYQYDRSVYIAVGAMGPRMPASLPDTWSAGADSTTLRDSWMQVRDITQAKDWNESSFAAPPWNGIRVNKRNGFESMITAPMEMK